MTDCVTPSVKLLVKLGSIVVHTDEMLSASGHAFDVEVLKIALRDPEVNEWVNQMNTLALLPVKRGNKMNTKWICSDCKNEATHIYHDEDNQLVHVCDKHFLG